MVFKKTLRAHYGNKRSNMGKVASKKDADKKTMKWCKCSRNQTNNQKFNVAPPVFTVFAISIVDFEHVFAGGKP